MNRLIFIIIALLIAATAFGQINFRQLSFDEALAAAKTEDKYVFIDCYTSWCGPCKMMADRVLPQKEVGDYMNDKFVCIKIDMEKGEGPELAKRFAVTAYPTFLIVKGDGSLAHRVVGGEPDGKKFIEKVDAAFDANSAANLEAEYAAGNRKMDFLLKYTKALLEAGNAEKAKAVGLDIITSLEDAQRCTKPYWFIYEDFRLSPIGSGNLAYLLRHVDQFRKNVGVEKVDKKLASLFGLQFEEIIRGRNTDVTPELLEGLRANLDKFHLTGQDYLYDYVDLIQGMAEGDTEKVLAASEKVFPALPDEKIAYLYFTPILNLRDKWTKEQAKELIALTDRLIEQVEMSTLKNSLANFKAGILEKI